MKRAAGRTVALIAGLGMLGVLVTALAFRDRIWAAYLEHCWKQIDVVVLDDCDPDFEGPGPHGDAIRFLDEGGRELFHRAGLNNCQTVGANHGIALDSKRFRIYLRELAGKRITALDATGRVLFRIEDVEVSALALDPLSGNLWSTCGPSLDRGEVLVFDYGGHRIGVHPIVGHDIAYSLHDESFWVVGYGITKCDRDGKVLVTIPKVGWCTVAVAPDPRDGGAWVVERDHRDVKGSANRLLRLDARGNLARTVDLGKQDPFGVACDPKTGMAWMVEYRKALLRVPVEGPPLDPISIPALAITIGAEGNIWVTTPTMVFKLGADRREMAACPFIKPSNQSWLAAP